MIPKIAVIVTETGEDETNVFSPRPSMAHAAINPSMCAVGMTEEEAVENLKSVERSKLIEITLEELIAEGVMAD